MAIIEHIEEKRQLETRILKHIHNSSRENKENHQPWFGYVFFITIQFCQL